MQQKEVTTEEAIEIINYLNYHQEKSPRYITPPINWAFKRLTKLMWLHTSHVIMNQHIPDYQTTDSFAKRVKCVLDAGELFMKEVSSQLKRENP